MKRHPLRRLAWVIPVLTVALAAFLRPAAADGRSVKDTLALKKAAARIDSLVEKALRDKGLAPAALADDATFARRTYLALAGRIPTLDEVQSFVRSAASEKHRKLVDQLLASRGYESHMFNWWADLLRARTRLPRRISGEPYVHWIKESIARNRPYDEIVHKLLTATGPVHQRGNGATGYLMRDRNMPEDNMSNTIRLFLGSRVECAQCHNHPFDKWTQRQYFEMVAFTGGIQYQQNFRRDSRARSLVQKANQKYGRNGVRALRRTMEPLYVGIYGSGTGAVRLPKDYQYDDAKPLSWVSAHALFSPDASVSPEYPNEERVRRRLRRNPRRLKRVLARMRPAEIDSRETFAKWMTSHENTRFAKVIANRIWKQAFGRGLVEPVDDIKDDTVAVIPELMDELTQLMIQLKFDLREFQRTLLSTRLWRRQAVAPADTPGQLADLRGPLLRRMTAEQAWDSLLTLVVPALDDKLAPPLSPRAEFVYNQYEQLSDATDEQILERTGQLVLRYTDPEKFRQARRAERQKRQAEMRRKRAQARPLFRELNRARRAGDDARVEEILAELQERGILLPGFRGGRALRDLQRASDLQSPAPAGHLIRELGQSDRDLIDAAHKDPTVPQVLALLNSFLEQRLLTNTQATLMRSLASTRGSKEKIRTAFLSVLGRHPTDRERSSWSRDISRGGPKAVQDLVWTLVNTHEFLFIQ